MDCIFCKIINGELPSKKIYEDEHYIAILDIMPVNYGHTLLIPKTHFRNILDMPDEYSNSIYYKVKQLAKAIKNGISCDGLNIIQNVESAGGQEVFHAHIHIVPRYKDDNFRLALQKKKYQDDAQMDRYAELIKNNL
ncbi:MAG: HIT family protein [Deferribacterota bacterium]|nr:HIT family protein [Deferribacterota bacterium]